MRHTVTATDLHGADHDPPGRFSYARVGVGTPVYVAGQTARDDRGEVVHPGDLAGQYDQVLVNLERVLDAAGGALADLTATTTYVTDMTAWKASDVDTIRGRYLSRPYPTSTLVEVSQLGSPDLMVEVDAVAHV
jgi:enamine deaminase RidA (YjgF/YER057c/UK114 family)